ncbi:guanitoxin biosynthesis heme-dependent pre-guanitoxin N-hydroxylase GntA [Nitrosomonas sp.]|uniref:guanitoxin biosynthesis heme-dependent pre-guanitoxin N-hydroxylase GntA n=1 Tax=Nitrosomonas sp. TaxID=42353 RepID=UPI00374DDE98
MNEDNKYLISDSLDRKALRGLLDEFLSREDYPCVPAKSANNRDNIELLVGDNITQPMNDVELYSALLDFGKNLTLDTIDNISFKTLINIYRQPTDLSEVEFEQALWDRLQNLHNFDAVRGQSWDENVDSDANSSHFSMSIGGHSFFIVGLHPHASRLARRFCYPALVFNLHAQFEVLREKNKYERIKGIVRKRDTEFSGGPNPMLDDFGNDSEAPQYSGRKVDENWECPLQHKENIKNR